MTTKIKSVRPARLVDVARVAHVSRSVAAQVILGTGGRNTRCSDETALRVMRAARKLKYRPNLAAQQLRGSRSGILGVLTLTSPNYVLTTRLTHLENEAYAAGYRVLIGPITETGSRTMEYVEDFIARNVEGIVFLAALRVHADSVRERLREISMPVVYYAESFRDEAVFNIDRARAVQSIVAHLAEQGCRKIGIEITSRLIGTMRMRINGYRKGMRGLGLKIDDELIYDANDFHEPPLDDPDWYAKAAKTVEYLVIRGGADAIIASNDTWAAFIIRDLEQRGIRVPDDVAVTGFDNTPLSCVVHNGITSVDQNNAAAARRIMEFIRNFDVTEQKRCEKIMIEPRLIIRASSLRGKR